MSNAYSEHKNSKGEATSSRAVFTTSAKFQEERREAFEEHLEETNTPRVSSHSFGKTSRVDAPSKPATQPDNLQRPLVRELKPVKTNEGLVYSPLAPQPPKVYTPPEVITLKDKKRRGKR